VVIGRRTVSHHGTAIACCGPAKAAGNRRQKRNKVTIPDLEHRPKRRLRRWAKRTAITLLVLAVAFVVVIGPWPAVGRRDLDSAPFFRQSLAELERAAKGLDRPRSAAFRVGYGHALLTPPIGSPLAGYGARKGKPSTGVLDDLEVEALSLNNGHNQVVLVTADILLFTQPLSTAVWKRLEGKVPLERDDIFFTASHTHSGPGGWSQNFVEKMFAGNFRRDVFDLITSRTAQAVAASLANQEPASFTLRRLDMPDHVRNRTTRDGPVDDDLDMLVFATSRGRKFLLLSYSAHPTTIDPDGEKGFLVSADYPGRLRRAVEKALGVEALYMAGCLGSSGPRNSDRIGEALAEKVIAAQADLPPAKAEVVLAPLSFAMTMPPRQYLLGERGRWRLSPIFVSHVVPSHAHLRSLRLDDVLMVFCPCELSCEIAIELKAFAKEKGLTLIIAAMNGEYTGYVTPDTYYGRRGYETRDMNFYAYSGSFYERLIRDLITHHAQALPPN